MSHTIQFYELQPGHNVLGLPTGYRVLEAGVRHRALGPSSSLYEEPGHIGVYVLADVTLTLVRAEFQVLRHVQDTLEVSGQYDYVGSITRSSRLFVFHERA